jgi:pimeloyl-ACP methyl ester carboxylesterase
MTSSSSPTGSSPTGSSKPASGQTSRRVAVGEVSLQVVTEGEGPPVLLLHGFPEFHESWRYQLTALAQAGFQAIAPDLRGYGLSDKPEGVDAYRVDRLERDLDGLIQALGHERVVLVGHDWGGALAWGFAARFPHRVSKLVICNAPHPTRFLETLRTRAQLSKSWYMFLFQLPFVPERFILRPGFVEQAFRGWAVHKENFPDEVLARFDAALRQPGAATSAIHYYRAALRHLRATTTLPFIHTPTLVLWGTEDRALDLLQLEGLERFVAPLTIYRVPRASHWVQQDAPEVVNRELLAFIRP